MVHDMYSRTSRLPRDERWDWTSWINCRIPLFKKKHALLGCFLIRSDDNNFVNVVQGVDTRALGKRNMLNYIFYMICLIY